MSNQAQQSTIAPCPACGGQRVGAPCYEGGIGRANKTGGVSYVAGLKALVCTVCGLATLYVNNVETLKKELLKHPEGFTY